jgi:hypothetical protein
LVEDAATLLFIESRAIVAHSDFDGRLPVQVAPRIRDVYLDRVTARR